MSANKNQINNIIKYFTHQVVDIALKENKIMITYVYINILYISTNFEFYQIIVFANTNTYINMYFSIIIIIIFIPETTIIAILLFNSCFKRIQKEHTIHYILCRHFRYTHRTLLTSYIYFVAFTHYYIAFQFVLFAINNVQVLIF